MTERTGLLFTHWKKIASPHPQEETLGTYYLQLRKIGPSWILGLWGLSTMETLRPKAIYG